MRFFNKRHHHRARFGSINAYNNSRATSARNGSRVSETIAGRTQGIRRAAWRNRVLLVTLLAVGGVVAVLTGISVAKGEWFPAIGVWEDPGRPRGRFGAATTFIEDQQQMLVFGGFVGSTSVSANGADVGNVTGPPIINDDGTHLFRPTHYFAGGWQRRDPIRRPSARGFAAMAYDGRNRNVVLFGGAPYNTNNVSGETWIWDNQNWIEQHPPEPRPDARQNAVMVYDAHRKVVVMFGGRGADGQPMNDTWTWNGSKWKTVPRTEGDPSPRHSAAIAYDFCRAEAVMFGGIGAPVNNTVSQPFETWTWNGAKWTPQSPKISPPPRIGAGMAYSMRTGNVLLYGGLDTRETGVPTAATDHDVWMWLPAGYPGTGNQLVPTWERMNSDVTSARDNVLHPLFLEPPTPRHSPPPRGYASFVAQFQENYFGSNFNLYGGTPSAPAAPTGLFDNLTAPLKGVQVAYGDHFFFGDRSNVESTFDVPLFGDTPLTRRCANPVPIPSDAPGQVGVPEAPKLDVREGMREVGQFPVLVGTDWPESNQDTHLMGAQKLPNPNYTPPPGCPRRRIEDGTTTYLFTDQKRNRVYQFFLCDPNRGYGYIDHPSGQYWGSYPQVPNLLIGAYDSMTLESIGTALLRNVDVNNSLSPSNIYHDPDRGRFLLRYSDNGSPKQIEVLPDLIEKGVDPIVSRTNPSFGSFNLYFNHPKSARAKAFYAISAGGATVGPPPAPSTPPKLAQWDLENARQDWQVEFPDCTPGSFTTMHLGNRVYTVCVRSSGFAVARVPITENADGSETPGVPEFFSAAGITTPAKVWMDPQTERVLLLTDLFGGTKLWVFDGKASRFVGRVGISGRVSQYSKFGFEGEAGRFYVHMSDATGQGFADQGGLLMIDTRLTPAPQPLKFPQYASPVATLPAGPIASLPSGPGVPRRILIRTPGGTMQKYPNWERVKFEKEMFYRVLADEVPVAELTDLAQLDALTIPVAETPGKTEVSFDAEGSSYGIRLRSVGGIWTAIRPPPQIFGAGGNGGTTVEGGIKQFASHLIPACVFPDRELMAGFVPQARLSDLDALARSSGLEVDSNSKTDLKGPFSRCNPTANASNFPASIKVVFDVLWPLWGMAQSEGNKLASQGVAAETGKDADGKCGELKQPTPVGEVVISDCTETPAGTITRGKDAQGNTTIRYQSTTSSWDSHFKEVECVGDTLKDYRAAVGNIYGSAKCVQTQGKVEAAARGSATGTGPTSTLTSSAGFSVAEGYSTVEVIREPNGRGVVVTSTAVAKGIQLPGASFGAGNLAPLSIDRVETKAVAWSNGSPSDPLENPRATFTRIICGVHDPEGKVPNGCLSSGQQQQFVDEWNRRWGANSQMYLPKPDPEYYLGSPGGYIAGVIKPVADEVEDQLFAKDFQREVPGLVIVFNKDTAAQGPGRQVLQLAAVRALAGLGVQCNPDYLYSPQKNECVPVPDDLLEEEFFEEDEEEFFEDDEEQLDGEWIPVEAGGPVESIGKKIGRLIQNLPVLRQLPIRQMGEALLASSVWVLLGLPLLFAWRRLSLNMEVRS